MKRPPQRGTVTLRVNRSEAGITLLEFVAMRMRASHKAAKRLLDDRLVFVNGRRTWMARHPLEERDEVEVQDPNAGGPERACTILWQDDRYLIADKPPGLLSNGARSAEAELRQEAGPGLQAVHRIDRDTSGCLLFAKDAEALRAMVDLFERHEVSKTYRAIVQGRFPARLSRVTRPLDHLEAVTRTRLLHVSERASELELEIETGRTHQIRRHVSAEGFPLVGDKQYNTGVLEDPSLRGIQRQMLHAWKLAFRQPLSGEAVAVEAPLPGDYRRCLARLGLAG